MLVPLKLEYASPIWNPHTSSHINLLERIQNYAARFVADDHRRTTSPTTLVLTLNWQTLERRRTIKQAMTFYKILNNTIEIGVRFPDHACFNISCKNLTLNIRDCLSVSFGGGTKIRRSLLVSMPGEVRTGGTGGVPLGYHLPIEH